MKTDDDMYINIKNLYQLVERNTIPHMLTGAIICRSKPNRNPHNKWYASKDMFQEDVYPDYVLGPGYVMSNSAANILFQMALTVPAFHMEDVYITGILPSKVATLDAKQMSILQSTLSYSNSNFLKLLVSNSKKLTQQVVITPKDDYRFSNTNRRNYGNACVYHQIISSHHLSMKHMRTMYESVLKVRLKPEECPKLEPKKLRPYSFKECMNSTES